MDSDPPKSHLQRRAREREEKRERERRTEGEKERSFTRFCSPSRHLSSLRSEHTHTRTHTHTHATHTHAHTRRVAPRVCRPRSATYVDDVGGVPLREGFVEAVFVEALHGRQIRRRAELLGRHCAHGAGRCGQRARVGREGGRERGGGEREREREGSA